MIRRSTGFLAGFLVLLLSAPALLAQGGRAEINGVVSDQDKAVLPGVTVTAINEGTALERVTVTSGDGRFVIPSLLPGSYTVTAALAGFQTATRKAVVISVGQEMTLNLSLLLAGVAESVTVTGQSPLVESTSSKIGTNVTNSEIDALPSANRSQFSLMQTIPGMVPVLQVGSFEGGQFSANGQATTNNLFLVDGQNDNDSRRGGSQGTQARVSLDSMAEYQVQTHQYGAEYGGSTGVVVNSVTKSGTNKVSGRVFEYFQDNKLMATNYFLKQEGESNPESGSNVFGGSIGGPIVPNKFFYFFNYEGTSASQAANLSFPAVAAPLATSYSTTTAFHGPNTFLRLDYHLNGNNQLSFRWTREAIITERDSIETDLAIPDAARHENDAGDQVFSGSWTSVLNNRTTNELKFGHVRESLLQGPSSLFDSDWKFIGFAGVDPFNVGSQNTHPDYIAGPRNTYTQDLIRDFNIDDQLTLIKSDWGGQHSFKIGGAYSRNAALPQGTAANFIGLFTFPTDVPFNAADPKTYPFRFRVAMGQYDFDQIDHRGSGYISDKWQLSRKLTLNVGVRYDWQSATKLTKDAIGPRLGVAYDLLGDSKTLIRGGFGKVYQYQQLAILATLEQRAVISPTLAYDTAQVASPAVTGTYPVKAGDANATACLNPIGSTTAGEAVYQPDVPDISRDNPQPGAGGRLRQQHHNRTDRRRRSAHGLHVGVQRRHQTRTVQHHGRVDRLRGQSRQGQHRRHRHQRRTGQSRHGPGHPARRGRLRPDGRTRSARGSQLDVRPVQPGADQGAGVGARFGFQLGGAGARKAHVAAVVRTGQLYLRSLLRRRNGDHRRQQSAARLRTLRPRQHARVCREREFRSGQGFWHRFRVPHLLGIPDQRDSGYGRQRRRHGE